MGDTLVHKHIVNNHTVAAVDAPAFASSTKVVPDEKLVSILEKSLPKMSIEPTSKDKIVAEGLSDRKVNELDLKIDQGVTETVTDEQLNEVAQSVARKIIKNDDRIDEIIQQMQKLEDARAVATSPAEREWIRAQLDDLLDELIVRTSTAFAHLTQEEVFLIRDFVKKDVESLKGAMQDKTLLIGSIVIGVVGIGGAALGFSQGGLLGFTASQVKAASATAAAASQSGTLTVQYLQQSSQGKAEIYRYLKEFDQTSERDKGDGKSKALNLVKETVDLRQSKERNRHEAWSANN